MLNYEAKEIFWANKGMELREKLKNLSKASKKANQTERTKMSKKEASYEELRLINELNQEEVKDLRSELSKERENIRKLERKLMILKEKLKETEKTNKSLTDLLIERENQASIHPTRQKNADSQEINKYRDQKIQLERENKQLKESFDTKLLNYQSKLTEKENEINNLKDYIKNIENQLNFSNQENHDYKDQIQKLQQEIRFLQSEFEAVKNKPVSVSTSSKIIKLKEKLKKIKDENINLQDQVDIYREDHSKKMMENNLLQQLSYIILSKDKSSLDLDAANLLKKTIGENPTKLIESFQEKAFAFEQENNVLSQKVTQELQLRIENLEKIKSLQENLNKLLKEPSLETEINKTKMQIATAKSSLSNIYMSKKNNAGDLRVQDEEYEINRVEARGLRGEIERLKDENYRYIDLISELENKLSYYLARPVESDIICFIQCEAAALEDMLADTGSPDLDSEELY